MTLHLSRINQITNLFRFKLKSFEEPGFFVLCDYHVTLVVGAKLTKDPMNFFNISIRLLDYIYIA